MKMPNSCVLAALERAERRSRGEDPYAPQPAKQAPSRKKSGKAPTPAEVRQLLHDAYRHIQLGSSGSGISRKEIMARLYAAWERGAP